MADSFFEQPVLNSPYACPSRHWELDAQGQPTQKILDSRRRAAYITPIPKPRKRKSAPKQKGSNRKFADQGLLVFDEGKNLSSADQMYDPIPVINAIRSYVDEWRRIPDPADWKVTPETARLLRHWRNAEQSHSAGNFRPFFCQVEAVETLIWLTEVVPQLGKKENAFFDHLKNANAEANPELFRIALKMATGSGKTTVMAMIIAWQTVNAVRRPQSKRFTRGFLIVTPGITIRDRLRVLYPSDPDSYYEHRSLLPHDMIADIKKAKIVITNFHAFMLREKMNLLKGTRSLLQGHNAPIKSTETEGQMVQRVMQELMHIKNIMVINDEAHHCYREKPDGEDSVDELKGDEKEEAKENNEAARVWINGLETVKRRLGIHTIIDLSATPFFLRGSGYAEGTLFHWTVSDFSLMDAIECGIVKLPRVPVSDNIPGAEMPIYRNLWEHIGKEMPRKSRANAGALNPADLPPKLRTALETLYGHYEKTFALWEEAKIDVPPCFIIVCNNTAASKLVYDFISGYYHERTDGSKNFENGSLALFRNFDDDGNPLARPRTLLIDSHQLESDDNLDDHFREAAKDEIERFRVERLQRSGSREEADNISDKELLREVMNTVGKPGRLGESIRCVVSVAMLSEGWDANTVTHVLGIRAFGTQLLCEQVIGRALRRQSYDLNEDEKFDVEYADIFGIPFDFTAKPSPPTPRLPKATVHVRAVSPERDKLEIRFPRIAGYRAELPEEKLAARFTADSTLVLTPEIVGPTKVKTSGIIGEDADFDVKHLENTRDAEIIYKLTQRLLDTKFRDENGELKLHLFGQLKKICAQWYTEHLVCKGGVYPAMILYQYLADIACERIEKAISAHFLNEEKKPVRVVLDPYNKEGSSIHVNFHSGKLRRWQTDPRKCHVNWAIADSDWELEFCRLVEDNKHVVSYVKNSGLGLEVPYRLGSQNRIYIPDYIVLVDDGSGPDNLLHLIIEVKGYRKEDAKEKRLTMENFWIPGVNRLGVYGRWAFAEFTEVFEMQDAFDELVDRFVGEEIEMAK